MAHAHHDLFVPPTLTCHAEAVRSGWPIKHSGVAGMNLNVKFKQCATTHNQPHQDSYAVFQSAGGELIAQNSGAG